MKTKQLIAVSAIVLALTGCGGGSSNGTAPASVASDTSASAPVAASSPATTSDSSTNTPSDSSTPNSGNTSTPPATSTDSGSTTTPPVTTPSSGGTTVTTPSGGSTVVTTPTSGGSGSTTAPPTSGSGSTTTPPASGGSTTTPPASGGDTTTPPVTTPPVTTPPVTTPPVTTPPSTTKPKLECTAPQVSSASAGSGLISADTPTADGSRMYQEGTPFQVALTTRPGSADTLNWAITDYQSTVVASGSFAVPSAATTSTLSCTSTLAGYFAVQATLAKAGGAITKRGSTPAGYTTFGVIANLASVIPSVNFPTQEQHRFGMQGFNGNKNLLNALGISSVIDDRQMAVMEPSSKNSFNPASNSLDPFFADGSIMRLIRLDGISSFVSPTGAAYDSSYAPTDEAYYQNYMARVGTESARVLKQTYPNQSHNYYQVTWEPIVQWKDTNANMVAMYKSAYAGLHSTDTKAVVMGPAEPFPSLTTQRLQQLAPLGLASYIDGIATHGYYDAGTMPSHPPERLQTAADPADAANSLMNEIKLLRAEMAKEYKPGMKLFVTETGISYDLGTTYNDTISPNVLYAHGMVTLRSHIILLGEGADQTYVFFGPDYPDEVGYGTFFDLDHTAGAFGASNIAPKPAAMAVAAMTRILDGTSTLGPVNGVPAGVYAYAFQQLGGGEVITAVWQHNNATWDASVGFSSTNSKSYSLVVDSSGSSGTVQVIDAMGNATSQPYTNGAITLTLTESPQYVVSTNVSVAKANSTLPQGYTGN